MAHMRLIIPPIRRFSVDSRSHNKVFKFPKSSTALAKNHHNDGIIIINVGGTKFETHMNTLHSVPGTLLSRSSKESEYYNKERGEYFFDRNPEYFNCILDLYRHGLLHLPNHLCMIALKFELEFWEIDDQSISRCCQRAYESGLEELNTNEMVGEEMKAFSWHDTRCLSADPLPKWRRVLWNFLHDHKSSNAAKVFSVGFYILLIASIASFFIGTLSSCRVPSPTILHDSYQSSEVVTNNSTAPTAQSHLHPDPYLADLSVNNTKVRRLLTTHPHDALLYIDLICMVFFSLEFFLRFSVCPSKLKLLRSFGTICDLVYLIPVWIIYLIKVVDPEFWYDAHRIVGLLFLQGCMMLRSLRILRLIRFYHGLRVLFLTIRASAMELVHLLSFVCIAMIIFASFIYLAEFFVEDTFESVFSGLWWALVTMTTVGYGDMVPKSWLGCVIAGVCAITGIIIIGMPIPIIASNFSLYYGYAESPTRPNQNVVDLEPRSDSVTNFEDLVTTVIINTKSSTSSEQPSVELNTQDS